MGNNAVQKLSKPADIKNGKRKISLQQKLTQIESQIDQFQNEKKPNKFGGRRCNSDLMNRKTDEVQQKNRLNEEQVLDLKKLKKLRDMTQQKNIQQRRKSNIILQNITDQENCHKTQQNQKNQKVFNKSKMIFILDWDDTLFFTSHVVRQHRLIRSANVDPQVLKDFDQIVTKILNFCISYGIVYIVTSSEDGWVKQSCQLFLPLTFQIIFKTKTIKVISSRQIIQTNDNQIILKNKNRVFQRIVQRMILQKQATLAQQCSLDLVCIGDSQQQIQSASNVYEHFHKKFKNFYVKTIKMKRNPNIADLKEQLELIFKKIETIVNTKKKLTITLQRNDNQFKKVEKIL